MASQQWKEFVPEAYIPITTCYIVLRNKALNDKESESGADVAICTTGGQLLEFSKKLICGMCDIPLSHAEKIVEFSSFCPLRKYYIVSSFSEIVVVSRLKTLEVVKTYHGVDNLEVGDFLSLGFPQVRIKYIGKEEPLITNFEESYSASTQSVSGLCENNKCAEVVQIMKQKLVAIEQRLNERRRQLNDKKRCRNAAIDQLLEKCHEHKNQSQNPQLVRLIGDGDNTCGEIVRDTILQVRDVWQRINNGRWILGITVNNQGARAVKHVKLLLACDKENIVYETRIVLLGSEIPQCQGRRSREGTMKNKEISYLEAMQGTLEPNSSAVVMAVMDIPTFLGGSEVLLHGTIKYSTIEEIYLPEYDDCDESSQVCFEPVKLKSESVADGRLLPFSAENTRGVELEVLKDRLSIVVSSEEVELCVRFACEIQCSICDILVEQLHFDNVGCGALIHQGQRKPGFAGLLVTLNDVSAMETTFILYGRDQNQLILFAHAMYEVLPDNTVIRSTQSLRQDVKSGSNLEKCKEALVMEVNFIAEQLEKFARESSDACVVRNEVPVSSSQTASLTNEYEAERDAFLSRTEKDISVSLEEYASFRKNLVKLEIETDDSFFKCNQ